MRSEGGVSHGKAKLDHHIHPLPLPRLPLPQPRLYLLRKGRELHEDGGGGDRGAEPEEGPPQSEEERFGEPEQCFRGTSIEPQF